MDSHSSQASLIRASRFTVQLSSPIELNGPFKVSLRTLIYPSSFMNVVSCQYAYRSLAKGGRMFLVPILDGHYTITQLIDVMNQQFERSGDGATYRLKVESSTRSLSMLIRPPVSGGVTTISPYIEFSQDLRDILGLPKECSRSVFSATYCEIGANHVMYCLLDCVEHSPVGSGLLPLLALVPFDTSLRAMHHHWSPGCSPITVTVKTRHISSLTMSILNADLQPIRWLPDVGNVTAQLLFTPITVDDL